MTNSLTNQWSEVLCRRFPESNISFLDRNNILWRVVDGRWIGKRSGWTLNYSAVWMEETTIENVKTWWCGIDADYNETFYGYKLF